MVGQLQVGEKIKLHKLLSQMLKVRDTTADIRDVNIGNPRAVVGQLLKFMKAIGVSEEDVTIASIDRILNRKVGKGALPKCEALWTFISAQTDDRLKREALLQIGFRLHYDELRTWVNVVGIDQMLQFLDRVPACFDSQFPGYASQRLLEKLVSTRKR
jgi:hypothetical protein